MEEENKNIETEPTVEENETVEPTEETPTEETTVEETPVEENKDAEVPAPTEEQAAPEQKKKSKKPLVITIIVVSVLLLAGIIVAIVLILNNGKKEEGQQTSDTTETTTTTTEIVVPREAKLTLYKYVLTYDYDDEKYEGIVAEKYKEYANSRSHYTYEPFTISCETKSCSFEMANADRTLILIKDGKTYSVVTIDDKLIAREVAKDLINKGNKLFPDANVFGKTVSGDLYVGFNVGEQYSEKVVLYNISKDTNSGILKDTDFYCGDDEYGCPDNITKYTDYYLLPKTKKELGAYNIVENKWEDFTFPYNLFMIGNDQKKYFATQYIKYETYFQDGTIIDLNGKVIKKNLNYVGSYKDNIYIQTNDNLQKLDVNLNQQKQISNVTKTYMSGKDFILVNLNGKLMLYDNDLNVLATFIEDFNEDRYFVHTALSGWFTDQGKNGIYIVVEDDELEDDTSEMGQGYEYYYIPSTGETGKIRTEIGGYAKPVLYLYPKKETNVKVTFDKPEMLTTTYPKYINSWDVRVKPNGDMYDKNGKYYYALYWEEMKNHEVSFNEGFYVTKENAITFLEDKLKTIGLNDKERNEFIMYWLPILEKNGQSLVYFELTEERNKYSPITIKPAPDSLLRIAMHVKKVDKKVNIKEQKLKTFNRKGFVAVEWGGVIH